MFQACNLRFVTESGCAFLLSNLQLTLLVFSDVLDFDFATECREQPFSSFINCCLQFSYLILDFVGCRLGL